MRMDRPVGRTKHSQPYVPQRTGTSRSQGRKTQMPRGALSIDPFNSCYLHLTDEETDSEVKQLA